eukprot:scaffold31755_cov90-Isochrysis_galbana.AAC.2
MSVMPILDNSVVVVVVVVAGWESFIACQSLCPRFYDHFIFKEFFSWFLEIISVTPGFSGSSVFGMNRGKPQLGRWAFCWEGGFGAAQNVGSGRFWCSVGECLVGRHASGRAVE